MLARVSKALDDLVANAGAVLAHTDVYDLEPGHSARNPKVRRIKLPHSHNAGLLGAGAISAPGCDPGKASGPVRRAAMRQLDAADLGISSRMAGSRS